MSDNRKRYRAIKAGLKQLYPRAVQGHLAQHLNVLAALISGLVGSQHTQLPKVASKIPGPSQPASRAHPVWHGFAMPRSEATRHRT